MFNFGSCPIEHKTSQAEKKITVVKSFGVVSSTFKIVQILVHSHFDLVFWLLALEATEPVSEPVTQMAVELINIHLISAQQKR